MPSKAEILRNACAANDLGTSGSVSVLLSRLVNASKKKPTETKSMKPATPIKKSTSDGNNTSKDKKKGKNEGKSKGKVGRPLGSKNKPKPAAAKKSVAAKKPVAAEKHFNSMGSAAAYYFYDVCGGKISRCIPQLMMHKNMNRMKEIRLVKGPNGSYPKWVLVK